MRRAASTACSRSRSGTASAGALFLARDRFGDQAALLRARRRRRCCSAPRSRRFLEHPGVPRRASSRAAPARVLHLPEHLHRRHAVRGRAAAAAGCTADGRARRADRVDCERYWDFDFREPDAARSARASTVEELDRLFRQAVERQLVSDVPVGAYLSGGMDSGSITAVAAQRAARGCTTFTGRLRPAPRRPGSSSASTSARRPRRCRTCSRPSTTRWC